MADPSTLVLLPAGGSNYRLVPDRSSGPLASQLPVRAEWVRQALVEAAMSKGWRFSHQQQLDSEGGAIQLTFEFS